MEGFDLISTGVWSIIPPILALGLALITKEVYSSLAIGVFVGMVIYQFSLNGVGVEPLVDSASPRSASRRASLRSSTIVAASFTTAVCRLSLRVPARPV